MKITRITKNAKKKHNNSRKPIQQKTTYYISRWPLDKKLLRQIRYMDYKYNYNYVILINKSKILQFMHLKTIPIYEMKILKF